MKVKAAWYGLPIAVLLVLIIGPILRDGMFLDGLVYTNIAKNLAEGTGTLWEPLVFRQGQVFYEHPVLLPWIASFFFSVFGDGLHTEDLYNATVLLLTILCLYAIWRALTVKRHHWLFFFPLLLWVLNQEVQLRYPNAMLECGTTLIILFFTWLYLKSDKGWLGLVLVGIGAFVTFFGKGPIGLFLLGVPALYQSIVAKRLSWLSIVVPVLVSLVLYTLFMMLVPEGHNFILRYFDQQVVAAIAGERVENIADTRFDFLFWLVAMNVPAIILIIGVRWVKPLSVDLDTKRSAAAGRWLLSVGATAILPLVISIKQAAYYQLPSLPFFALGAGLLLLPRLEQMTDWVAQNTFRSRVLMVTATAGVMVTAYLAFSMLGTVDRRDREMLQRVDKLAEVFQQVDAKDYNLMFGGDISSAANRSYRLTNFLARYHGIDLSQSQQEKIVLLIRHGGQETPQGMQIIFNEDGLLLLQRE